MTQLEEAANKTLSELTAGRITEDEAQRQLIALGVDPAHAEEMIFITLGGSDIEEV